jgi:hypothetical protein
VLPSIARPIVRPFARPAPARRSIGDRILGVSRRRRQAAYLAIGSGLKLLQPMLRRIGALVGSLVAVAFVSFYVRLVF